MRTSEVLRAAAKRIAEPEGWCQGDYSIGNQVCALGAVEELQYAGVTYEEACAANDKLDEAAGTWPALVNDHGPPSYAHPRVLQMYARAIELAEVEEQASGLSGSHESSGSLPSPLAVEPGNTGSASEGARIAGSQKVMA